MRLPLVALPLALALTAAGCGAASVPEPSRDPSPSEWAYAAIVARELDDMGLLWWVDLGSGPMIPSNGVDVYEGTVVVREHLQMSSPPSLPDTLCDDIVRSLDRTAGDRPDGVAVTEVWFHRTWREPMAIFTLNQGEDVVQCELAAETLSP